MKNVNRPLNHFLRWLQGVLFMDHTQIEVVHAVRHQHIVEQNESWVIISREESGMSVSPTDIPLCHRNTRTSQMKRLIKHLTKGSDVNTYQSGFCIL